jgi:nucleotide-binding universal stress UspA family protein
MKVLLAIDSSGASQYVIAEAVSRPWPTGTVLCAQSIVDVRAWGGMPVLIQDAKDQAKALVTAAADELSRSGHEVVSEIQSGVPRQAISDYAKEWGADLVMVGFHRSNALTRFLLGSVAHGVLRSAPCSVEVVRPSSQGVPAYSQGTKILVGADGSPCSEKATYSVANRPWPAETLVRVISVREPVVPESELTISFDNLYPADLMDEILERERRRAETALTRAQEILGSAGLKLCDSSGTLFGDPRAVLVDEAKSWGADLLVVGSHGRHGLDRVFLGSVSESVAIHAHCSVEVIRDSEETGKL